MNSRLSDRENFAAFLMRMRAKGVSNPDLLGAFESTPRRGFVPAEFSNAAYSNRTVPIDCGEVIEGIDLQATMISLLGVEQTHRVLEIGTGSGYSAAVMSRLAQRVTTVERFKTLAEHARSRFEALRLTNITVRHTDGKAGLINEGPFDRIIVWAAFDSLPRMFVDQLSSSGVMIAVIGPDDGEQIVTRLTKIGSRFEREDIMSVRFQPLAGTLAAAL